MKNLILTAAFAGLAFMITGCDVEQTEEGEMPEVQGGNLPEYEVDGPDVNVDAGTREVEVPDTISVPTLDVDVEPADASENENKNR